MKKIYLLFLSALVAASCSNDNSPYDPAPDEEDPDVEITVEEIDIPNFYILKTNVQSTTYSWDTGKGDNRTVTGNGVLVSYPLKGTYTIVLSYRDEKTYETRKRTKQLVVGKDDEDLLAADADPLLKKLTGGSEYPYGKTWVIDSTAVDHLGNGARNGERWWKAEPYEKSGQGLYDDKITFTYRKDVYYENNGTTYVQIDAIEEMRSRGVTTFLDNEYNSDKIALYTPGNNWTWSITEEEGVNSIVFPDGEAFMLFYTPSPHNYEILEITDDYMVIRQVLDEWLVYYYRLIREGWDGQTGGGTDPGDVNVFVYEDFEGDSFFNLGFESDQGQSAMGVDNPDKSGLNTSDKVARYYKSTEYYTRSAWYTGDDRFDLATYGKVSLKVYFPSSNDYDTQNAGEDWLEDKRLRNAVVVKFQNDDDDEPWNTQISDGAWDLELDTWHQITFDFSNYASRTDFNIFIIQFGNEGHGGAGTFYFDDVMIYGEE